MKNKFYIVLFSVILSGCFSSRNIVSVTDTRPEKTNPDTLCENITSYQSLFINKIKASVLLDGEKYAAKVSLYYIADSIIYFTAANTGFEIIRAAITADSTVLINRIDKLVYIYKENETGYNAPVKFSDLELLLNRKLVCGERNNFKESNQDFQLDFSSNNVIKKITYRNEDLKISKFEFFHTKSSEYIVGEMSGIDSLTVFSNYIIGDIEIKTSGGEVEYNRQLPIDLSFNRNKYIIIDH